MSYDEGSLYSGKRILARGLAHPLVFTGNTTPRVLDRAVDGIVEQGDQKSKGNKPNETVLLEESRRTTEGQSGAVEQSRGLNFMQQFFSKVRATLYKCYIV